jgi:hypothetical protein
MTSLANSSEILIHVKELIVSFFIYKDSSFMFTIRMTKKYKTRVFNKHHKEI